MLIGVIAAISIRLPPTVTGTSSAVSVPQVGKSSDVLAPAAVTTSAMQGLRVADGETQPNQTDRPDQNTKRDITQPASAAPVAAILPPPIEQSVPTPSATGKDWLDTRMAVDVVRLRGLPTGNYAIQLMTADPREKAAIENFLRAASRELNPDRIMIYPAGTTEKPQLSVLYGSYTERTDANSEISRLPLRLNKFNAYARSIQAIRDDIRSGF